MNPQSPYYNSVQSPYSNIIPRIKGVNESPKKSTTKVSREGRVGHCSLCGNEGHNIRRCPSESEADRSKRKRLNEEARMQARVAAQVEGVSSTAPQASQLQFDA
ncbi:unnamed protein product [Arabis nemorensis]|uniref:CCHC-type domain-containing protein n=1 Tax=Arabis nemorensis TaxID=586526 RepID=A0A565CH73_9BRAS|nr:unnamed protein product [Arabis nemorensis]